jgi:hypothetical protein
VNVHPEICVSGRTFDEIMAFETSIRESNFPAIFLKRPRSHVILEVEDESLRSSAVHISGDKPNTLFDGENPSMAVVIRLKPVVVAGDHSVTIAEQEALHIVVVILLQRSEVLLVFLILFHV